ncbi:MAG TPA: acyl-CoA dehydrogenase family protein [Nocardioides sp.]
MSDLDLLHTDVEDDLRASVRALLRDRCDPTVVAGLYDGQPGPTGLWESLSRDLGLAGLVVPESLGGAGASAREAAVVMEEVGRAVAPVPFLTSSVMATTLLLRAGGDPADGLVRELASGERTAALVVPFSTGVGGALPALSAADGRVSGELRSVAGALEADLLLVPVATADGVDVLAVEAADATIDPVVSLDMTRQVADVTLSGASGTLVASGPEGASAVHAALLAGAALLASEQVGAAQWCLESTVAYLKERRPFGRVVGGFQALKHRLADLVVEVESALAAARYAAAALAAGDPDTDVAASVAQAFCSETAVHAAEEAIQLHGGIGMTWEHPAHLYLKRAKADQVALGTAGHHRARLATLVDLPGAPTEGVPA